MGSRFDAGAAPATVAKFHVSTGDHWANGPGRCRDGPKGQLRSPETSLEPVGTRLIAVGGQEAEASGGRWTSHARSYPTSITTSSVLESEDGHGLRNEMLRLIRSRRDGFSLEQPFYIDPDFFRLDLELIWYRDWLFVGHDCELAKPGSYLHRAGRRLSRACWCATATGDPRLPQFLPASRQPRLHHRQGHVGEAGLPLSPVDLRPRRQAAVCAPDGRRLRQGAIRPEAGRLRKRRRLHLHLPGRPSPPISRRSGR